MLATITKTTLHFIKLSNIVVRRIATCHVPSRTMRAAMAAGYPTVLAMAEKPLGSPYTTRLMCLVSSSPVGWRSPTSFLKMIMSRSPFTDHGRDVVSTLCARVACSARVLLISANITDLCLTEGEFGFQMFCQSSQHAVGMRHRLVAQHSKPKHTQTKKQDFTSQWNNLHKAVLKALKENYLDLTPRQRCGSPHILG